MSEPTFEEMLTAYANAVFDCGAWVDKEDFVPDDDTPEWKPYDEIHEPVKQARAALVEHNTKLEARINALVTANADLNLKLTWHEQERKRLLKESNALFKEVTPP